MAFPISPTNGQTTSLNGIKYTYNSASNSWTRISSPGASFTVTTDTFVGDGTQSSYSLSVTPASVDTLLVNIDGVQQQRTAYTLANNTITFTGTPVIGAVIEVKTWAAYNMSVITGLIYDSFTGNGSTVAFTLNAVPTSKNFTIVTIGGIVQAKNTYTIASNVITFSTAPPNTAPIEVTTLGPAVNGSMAGGTNTTVQFNNNGVLDGLTNLTISGGALNAPNVIVSGNLTSSNLTVSSTSTMANVTVTGTVTSANESIGNLTTTGNVTLGTVANVHITGGTNGQFLATDGAGNLSFNTITIPGSFTATANGAITTGNPVIVNSDATVTPVTAISEGLSSETLVSLTGYNTNYTAFDSATGKILSLYLLSSAIYGVVGTYSNGTVTWGTVTSALISGFTINAITQVLSIGSSRFVMGVSDTTNTQSKFYVFTVSGTSVLVGSPTACGSPSSTGISADRAALAFEPATGLLMYASNVSTDYYWRVTAAIITGTTIGTFGSPATVLYHNNGVDQIFGYYTGGKFFMFGKYNQSPGYIYTYYATFSGTTATVTSSTTSNNDGGVQYYGAVTIAVNPSTNKLVMAGFNTAITTATINTTAGTITWGSATFYNSILLANTYKQILYDPSIDKFIIFVGNGADPGPIAYATVNPYGINISTVVASSAVVPGNMSVYYAIPVYLGLGKTLIQSQTSSVDSTTFRTRVWQSYSTNLTTDNYVGYAFNTVSNGQTATILSAGAITSSVSGLTPGTKYYLTSAGALSTSTIMTPNVVAGTAITSTKLIIKG